jgi:hypothetical protein
VWRVQPTNYLRYPRWCRLRMGETPRMDRDAACRPEADHRILDLVSEHRKDFGWLVTECSQCPRWVNRIALTRCLRVLRSDSGPLPTGALLRDLGSWA